MISSENRFSGSNSLKYVYSHGHTVRGPLFAVKTVKNPRRETYRLAVVVGRKVNKSAVARNTMRRRVYEAVRELAPGIEGAHDVVITIFHDSVLGTPHKALSNQLKKQLTQAGILTKSLR